MSRHDHTVKDIEESNIRLCRDMRTLSKTLKNKASAMSQHGDVELPNLFQFLAHFLRTIHSTLVIIIRVRTLRQGTSYSRVSYLSFSEHSTDSILVVFAWF